MSLCPFKTMLYVLEIGIPLSNGSIVSAALFLPAELARMDVTPLLESSR
jgi:hypothetical protein